LQKFLGHKKLNTTMVYARAHDQTVEADYFAAMERVEQRLDLAPAAEADGEPLPAGERTQLMALVERLAEPALEPPVRLDLVILMRALLGNAAPAPPPVEAFDYAQPP
jgi:hypothetical protein